MTKVKKIITNGGEGRISNKSARAAGNVRKCMAARAKPDAIVL
jgi:hypothetical protein